jgi:hypothetical protein
MPRGLYSTQNACARYILTDLFPTGERVRLNRCSHTGRVRFHIDVCCSYRRVSEKLRHRQNVSTRLEHQRREAVPRHMHTPAILLQPCSTEQPREHLPNRVPRRIQRPRRRPSLREEQRRICATPPLKYLRTHNEPHRESIPHNLRRNQAFLLRPRTPSGTRCYTARTSPGASRPASPMRLIPTWSTSRCPPLAAPHG